MTGRTESPEVHVAAAAIFNSLGQVLLALRPAHLHQGGLWEFPGGKVESGETVLDALKRELHEELGITVVAARPLIRVRHAYPDKSVVLDVWRIDHFRGEAQPREGQTLEWLAVNDLTTRQYPAANLPIVTAARLPSLYLITGEPLAGTSEFLKTLEQCLRGGARLIQLRAKCLANGDYLRLTREALMLCHAYSAQLLLNGCPECVQELGADGIHLSSSALMSLPQRPNPSEGWVAASCHNAAELAQAYAIKADFAVVSPVLATQSHSGASSLGWQGLRQLTELARLPVYALGGMRPEHLDLVYQHGAQGIAVISSMWNAPDPEQAVRELLLR